MIENLKGPQFSLKEICNTFQNENVAVIAAGFGTHLPGTPVGDSNKMIGQLVDQLVSSRILKNYNITVKEIVVQWDVKAAMSEWTPTTLVVGVPGETHIPTERFLSEMSRKLKESGIFRVIIIGQPLHAERILRHLSGMNGYAAYVWSGSSTVPFDKSPYNTQWWCREEYYYLWERLCRAKMLAHRIFGK